MTPTRAGRGAVSALTFFSVTSIEKGVHAGARGDRRARSYPSGAACPHSGSFLVRSLVPASATPLRADLTTE